MVDPYISAIKRAAVHTSWANTDDRAARTAPARAAFRARFLKQARERYGDLPADELAARAESLRLAHFAQLTARRLSKQRARKGTRDAAA